MFVYQVNQHELNFTLLATVTARSYLQLLVVDCSLSVTEKSVRVSVREILEHMGFQIAF